jgi:hypothetical protein
MNFDYEPLKLLVAFTSAYSILEPLVALMNYILYIRFGMKSMFQLYPKANPFLIVMAEYIYLCIILVKTMYIYKYVMKKDRYYPEKGDYENYGDFLLCFISILVVMDVLWAITINIITTKIPFLAFLNNYSRELGFYSLVRPIIFGLSLLVISYYVLYYMKDLEAIAFILFSIFTITIASF